MNSLHCKLVYFFGSDGTGKTTHANMIARYLTTQGFRTWRTSLKQHHTLSFLFLKLFAARKTGNSAINYYGFDSELAVKIRTPWKLLELISLAPAYLSRVFLPSMLGYIVVCDRYLLDTLVTLSFFLKEPKFISGTSSKILLQLIPRNSLLFYCEADTNIILQRKKDEPLTAQLVEYYKNAYRCLFRWSGLETVTIDTGKDSIEDIQAKILPLILSKH